VTDDHRIFHHSLGVLPRSAQGQIVNPQLGKLCAIREMEIGHDEIAFNRLRVFRSLRNLRA
jgi:hypothetical protein